MNKGMLIVLGLALFAGSVYAACLPNNVLCYDETRITTNIPLQSYTLAVTTSTAFPAGTQVLCTNCVVGNHVCTSTATAVNAMVISTGTACL